MSELKQTTERIILCLGGNHWGKGATAKEAIEKWRLAGGGGMLSRNAVVRFYDCPASFSIDDIDGTLYYHKDSPKPRLLHETQLRGGKLRPGVLSRIVP